MLELMKKYLMTLLTLGLACNAAACMEDEPFYDTEIPPHASIDNSKGCLLYTSDAADEL